jgi:hypothetical protein
MERRDQPATGRRPQEVSDIVERLRSLRHIHLPQLSDEAAAEIERLRGLLSRTGSDSRQTCDEAAECHSQSGKNPERERVANHPANPESSALTDAEREAVEGMLQAWGSLLRVLLERLSNPPGTDRQ